MFKSAKSKTFEFRNLKKQKHGSLVAYQEKKKKKKKKKKKQKKRKKDTI